MGPYADVHVPRAITNGPRQRAGEKFAGVIYSHRLRSPVGRCVDDLELIAKTFGHEDLENLVEFIPFP